MAPFPSGVGVGVLVGAGVWVTFGEAVGVQVFAGAACYVAGVFCMRRKRERGKG